MVTEVGGNADNITPEQMAALWSLSGAERSPAFIPALIASK
jgi:hypothetical protein